MSDEALKKLLYDDIIGNINQNLQLKNSTMEDALELKYTKRLGEYLYANLDNSGLETLKDMEQIDQQYEHGRES